MASSRDEETKDQRPELLAKSLYLVESRDKRQTSNLPSLTQGLKDQGYCNNVKFVDLYNYTVVIVEIIIEMAANFLLFPIKMWVLQLSING